MKLLTSAADRFVFELEAEEHVLLQDLLPQCPLIPAAYHQLTRAPGPHHDPGNQQLLEAAMSAHKQSLRQTVTGWLKDHAHLVTQKSGYRLTLSRAEMEEVLQVVNDLRVGSWVRIGCPDPAEGVEPKLTKANARYAILMDICLEWEDQLLSALDGPGVLDNPDHPDGSRDRE